jgi:TonB family protein
MKLSVLAVCASLLAGSGALRAGEPASPVPPPHANNECGSDYPQGALTADADGTTFFQAHISVEGKMQDVAVLKSSGRPDLDAAAASCSRFLYVQPPLKDGAPIDITWPFDVVWNHLGRSYFHLVRPAGYPTTCQASYPRSAALAHESGMTMVSFLIDEKGAVSAPAILKSSGFPDLDAATQDCVLKWRYLPAMHEGKPIAFTWRANINWTMR